MKLTENKLLRAIGEADEQMVEKAAPKLLPEDLETLRDFVPEQTEAPAPQRGRIIRRITEIGVLCAAVALCVFAGWGILKMQRGVFSNERKNGGMEEAKAVLAEYLRAVTNRDADNVFSLSLIDEINRLSPEDEQFTRDDLSKAWSIKKRFEDAELTDPPPALWAEKLVSGNGYDVLHRITNAKNMTLERIEYYALDGEPEKAEELRKQEQPFLDFLDSIEEAYCFEILPKGEDPEEYIGTRDVNVYCIGGKWYVDPFDWDKISDPERLSVSEDHRYRAYLCLKESNEGKMDDSYGKYVKIGPLIFGLCERGTDENDIVVEKHAELYLCDRAETSVVIPKEVNGYPVTRIRVAFQLCEELTSVTIPEGVTSIDRGAFSIGPSPYFNSYSYYEDYDNQDDESRLHSKLREIIIPESVSEIGEDAFWGTPWLEQKLKESPLVIINGMLYDGSECEGDVTIPDGVTVIGHNAFTSSNLLRKLTSVSLPQGLERIEYEAFRNCSDLTEITIPDSVADIGEFAFSGTPWLEQKQKENPLVIINGILIDGTACTGDIRIPDNVTAISPYAFASCNTITSVTVPGSVREIPYMTFQDCDNLRTVILEEGVETIISGVFSACENLQSVTIPESVSDIPIQEYVGGIGSLFQRDISVTIHGKAGSYAESYAKKRDIPFVAE